MDEVCSFQLLTVVRRMVLTLTQQNDESKEFVRFFHRQLGGILQVGAAAAAAGCTSGPESSASDSLSVSFFQDSLSKFEGRTLKDCGEDLLVEISEILFNELAFFRLMQDLDNNSSGSPAVTSKNKNKRRAEQASKEKHSPKVCPFNPVSMRQIEGHSPGD